MMTLTETWVAKTLPLGEDPPGTVRVGNIASEFGTLRIADVHAVISHYLENRELVDAYLMERRRQADIMQREAESQPRYVELRKKMLERRKQPRESK